jgi:hypothetical protein
MTRAPILTVGQGTNYILAHTTCHSDLQTLETAMPKNILWVTGAGGGRLIGDV